MSLFNSMIRASLWLLMSVLPLALMGCGVMQRGTEIVEESPLAARLVVGQIVGRYIEGKTDQLSSAQRIIRGATAVKEASTGEPLTLLELREVALMAAGVDQMSPADKDLALVFIDTLIAGVQERVGDGKLEGLTELTTLRTLAQWAIDVASMYVVQ